MTTKIALGDQVVDTITGFKGRVIASHSYIAGCTRLSVQPKVDKSGQLREARTFDEPLLKLVKRKKTKLHQATGGPSKHEDEGRQY